MWDSQLLKTEKEARNPRGLHGILVPDIVPVSHLRSIGCVWNRIRTLGLGHSSSEDATHVVDIDDYRLDVESGLGASCLVYLYMGFPLQMYLRGWFARRILSIAYVTSNLNRRQNVPWLQQNILSPNLNIGVLHMFVTPACPTEDSRCTQNEQRSLKYSTVSEGQSITD